MKELYNNLMALCDNDDTPFFYSDQVKSLGRDGLEYYRIFSYHFTNKESWLLPSALEARGIMFETTDSGEFIRIASRPMQKFFNRGESIRINKSNEDLLEVAKNAYKDGKLSEDLYLQLVRNPACIPKR